MKPIATLTCVAVLTAATANATLSVPVMGANPEWRTGRAGLLTRIDLSLDRTTNDDFSVGLVASNPLHQQPTIRDTLWVAAFAASRMTGKHLLGRRLQVRLTQPFRGTSAGLALALGVAAELDGRAFPKDFAATGEILPNGVIGPVDGVASKIAAVSQAGVRRVAIPLTPKTETVAGQEVDPVEWGRKLGVEVVRVRTLAEAYAWMRREPTREATLDERALLAVPPDVASVLTRQASNLIARLVAAGGTDSVETVRAELRAGRLFSARQFAQLDCARRMAAVKESSPSGDVPAASDAVESWVSADLYGIEEKIRQEAAQGAPAAKQAAERTFVSQLKRIQTEQAADLLRVCESDRAATGPGGLTLLEALAYGQEELFDQLTVADISEVGRHSAGHVTHQLYAVDPSMLVWQLTVNRFQWGTLRPTRARLAWAIARGLAVRTRFGGHLKIEEDRKTGVLSVSFDYDVYLGQFIEDSRMAALAAIAGERRVGRFPAQAIEAFECGERYRLRATTDQSAGLLAFEAYLRADLLCGDMRARN